MDLALAGAAELQQLLKFGPVGGLGAFAFLLEPLQYFVPFALAILFARAELRRQTQVLRLLFVLTRT
jgi:hypothetical protein